MCAFYNKMSESIYFNVSSNITKETLQQSHTITWIGTENEKKNEPVQSIS